MIRRRNLIPDFARCHHPSSSRPQLCFFTLEGCERVRSRMIARRAAAGIESYIRSPFARKDMVLSHDLHLLPAPAFSLSVLFSTIPSSYLTSRNSQDWHTHTHTFSPTSHFPLHCLFLLNSGSLLQLWLFQDPIPHYHHAGDPTGRVLHGRPLYAWTA